MEVEYDAGEHSKQVYSHHGLAMFQAQCLEHEIVNTLTLVELLPRRSGVREIDEWEAAVDEFMDEHFEHTLGRLIRDLKKVASIPNDLEAMLAEALETRNRLTHRYFRERAAEFMTPTGRDQMIEELQHAQQLIRSADAALHSTYSNLRDEFGLTEECIALAYEAMLSEIRDS